MLVKKNASKLPTNENFSQTLSFIYEEIENGLLAMEYKNPHIMGNVRLGKKGKNRRYKTNTWRVREERCSERNT